MSWFVQCWFVNSTLSRPCPPQTLLLTSETISSGGALTNHSYQDPSYKDMGGAPHRWAANTKWQAVTPEPQVPQIGLFRSTFDFSNNFLICSVESIMPSSSNNLKKGMHIEPGMWPGWTPVDNDKVVLLFSHTWSTIEQRECNKICLKLFLLWTNGSTAQLYEGKTNKLCPSPSYIFDHHQRLSILFCDHWFVCKDLQG